MPNENLNILYLPFIFHFGAIRRRERTNTYFSSAYSVPSSGPSTLGASQVASSRGLQRLISWPAAAQLPGNWLEMQILRPTWDPGISRSGDWPHAGFTSPAATDGRCVCRRTSGLRPPSRRHEIDHQTAAEKFRALSVSLPGAHSFWSVVAFQNKPRSSVFSSSHLHT